MAAWIPKESARKKGGLAGRCNMQPGRACYSAQYAPSQFARRLRSWERELGSEVFDY